MSEPARCALLQSAPMETAVPFDPRQAFVGPGEQAWRVIRLLNVFRMLVPLVLLLVFFFDAPTRSVGMYNPGMFLGISVAYFAFAVLCLKAIRARRPSAELQALGQLSVDTLAVTLLMHASGGVSSGLGTLLVLPAGATAAIVRPRFALFATAGIALALLFETVISALYGISASSDFLIAGLTGA